MEIEIEDLFKLTDYIESKKNEIEDLILEHYEEINNQMDILSYNIKKIKEQFDNSKEKQDVTDEEICDELEFDDLPFY